MIYFFKKELTVINKAVIAGLLNKGCPKVNTLPHSIYSIMHPPKSERLPTCQSMKTYCQDMLTKEHLYILHIFPMFLLTD